MQILYKFKKKMLLKFQCCIDFVPWVPSPRDLWSILQFCESGHAYPVNIVKQLLMNSPLLNGVAFSVINSHSLKLSLVISSEFFLFTNSISSLNTRCYFLIDFFQVFNFVSSCLTNNFIKLGRVFCRVEPYSFMTTIVLWHTRQITPCLCWTTTYFVYHLFLKVLHSSSTFCLLTVDILRLAKFYQG